MTAIRSRWWTLALYGVLVVVSIAWIVPIMTAIMTSVRPLTEIRGGWWHLGGATFTFDNYVEAWRQGLDGFVFNSFVITVGSVLVTVTVGVMAAYAFARLRMRFRKSLYFMFVSTMVVPVQLILIPLLPWFQTLGLNSPGWQYLGIILVHVGFGAGWAIFLMSSFFADVPSEIMQAAEVDGAGPWQSFRHIALPLAVPGVASFSIIYFVFVWNDLLLALTLLDRDHQPIQVGLTNLQSPHLLQQDIVSAGAVMAILPPLVLFLALNRFYIRGLFGGGVKA